MKDEDIRTLIEKYALQNAVKHAQPPVLDAVMRKLMGEHEELRARAKDIVPVIEQVLEEINSMHPEEHFERLQHIAPELLEELREKGEEQQAILPDLDIDEDTGVVMRFAPNPNGPATLGSTRGIVVNSEYTRRYDGKLILRFDDTDPQTKRPILEAYDWYLEDCEWLDAKPDEVITASDRVDTYYHYARLLIDMGHAYVCFCSQEDFKEGKDQGVPCDHRETDAKTNLELWDRMLKGDYDEGEAVLRIKTDMSYPNPALRDWVAFRVIRMPHPRVGDKYVVWPMLDFESAIEDHILDVTHIIRGKELRDSEGRQRFIYDYFGWNYPRTIHWGRMKIHEFGRMSTTAIKEDIDAGKYTGWDDVRLPTIRALKRRGFHSDAIRNFMLSLGLGENDVSLSLENLYAENRKIIDPMAKRYFFVQDPVSMEMEGDAPKKVEVPVHPDQDETRVIKVTCRLYITKDDANDLHVDDVLRLKNLRNIRVTGVEPLQAEYIGDDLDQVKKLSIIQWVPEDNIKVIVITPDGELNGVGERLITQEEGNVVQFERFGFVRIDSVEGDLVTVFFTHR